MLAVASRCDAAVVPQCEHVGVTTPNVRNRTLTVFHLLDSAIYRWAATCLSDLFDVLMRGLRNLEQSCWFIRNTEAREPSAAAEHGSSAGWRPFVTFVAATYATTWLGDLPLMKQLAKKYPARTKAQRELEDAAVVIRMDPDAVERACMARQLVLCTLPHSDPGDSSPRWLRRTGNSSLIIQPGWDGEEDKSFGYPFGSIPRLLLFWITTEVQRTKNRENMTDLEKRTLQLGRSLNDFMRAVGLNPYTGEGSEATESACTVRWTGF